MSTITNLLHHQAHLWIGDSDTLQTAASQAISQILCPQRGCSHCFICKQVAKNQHAHVNWIVPDGSYSLDQIDEILQNVNFKLHENEHRFLIFTQADSLTANCNNRLLKTIEEPHAGYIFLFLTTRTDTILPTLISRCFVQEFVQNNHSVAYEDFINLFTSSTFNQPLECLKLIEKYEIKERETKDIVDLLIATFYQQLKQAHQSNDVQKMITITHKIVLLKQALTQLPPPGSAKMFWKNLYLMFHTSK